MKKTNNQGFSLVELIIVVAIMAVLIGVLAPQYVKYVEKSRISADEDVADSLLKAAQVMCADEAHYQDITTSDTIVFDANGILPSTNVTAGMTEYFSDYANKKVKSKVYKTQAFTVSFDVDADGIVKAKGQWQ